MFFASVCRICDRELVAGEKMICLHCENHFPLWAASNADLRAHRLPRTAPIDGVWPWLAYSNADPVCGLIREGKFNDRPELIEELSRRYALWLQSKGCLNGIHAIVPVPMHWWKRMVRGYNQAELIAQTITDVTGLPTVKALKAVRSHSVQSRKSGAARASNVKGIFALNPRYKLSPGIRIALVDDIITTGSTISEAVNTIQAVGPSSITVLSLAATRLV